MTRRVKGRVFAGVTMAGAVAACAQLIGVEPLPELCGEELAWSGVPAAGARCPGELLGTFAIESDDGEKYGELRIYYDAAAARNCATAVAVGSVAGHADEIKVHLARCSETAGAPGCTRELTLSDPSREHRYLYDSYAGPITIEAKDHCIHASASILYAGQCALGSTGGAVFCE